MADAPPTRRRRRLRPVEVAAVERLGPRLVSVVFTGEFDGFEITQPAQHIKVLLPAGGQRHVDLPTPGPDGPGGRTGPGGPRPPMRTYTPRRFDPATGRLEVQFVIHGDGLASNWAERARVGDRLAIGGPGGRFNLGLGPGPWLIGGDESAVPAIGTLLEFLPAGTTGRVLVETDSGDPLDGLQPPEGISLEWMAADPGAPGESLRRAVAAAPLSGETSVWVACEATGVRRIRADLLATGRVGASAMATRGYWRLGQADHPDGDYGED